MKYEETDKAHLTPPPQDDAIFTHSRNFLTISSQPEQQKVKLNWL
jgi:hypothetical protein